VQGWIENLGHVSGNEVSLLLDKLVEDSDVE
jgi:hypothetical protein